MTIDKKTGEVIDWNKYFIYEDGQLYHHPDKKRQGISRAKRSLPVGCENSKGYLHVGINGGKYALHRIIYEMFHGVIPDKFVVDHIDGNPLNNRIENLRACTQKENLRNQRPSCNRKHGLPKGVYRDSRCSKGYFASVMVNGKVYRVGKCKTIEEAVEVATALRNEHHGEFARHH